MGNNKNIYVYENWTKETPRFIGVLHTDGGRGKEIFSFEYSEEWLKAVDMRLLLDPDLKLYSGRQYAPLEKEMFGIFADSCPDRWGRMLMKRREALNARDENRKPRALMESDFLLGVCDEARMGALRFSLEENGPFLSQDRELATPPWTTLRKLESASLEFEKDENSLNAKWLNQLLAPGSSLGGARPKATVQTPNKDLWIAKFPSKNDEWDSGAWEMIVHELAKSCGICVPEAKLEKFSKIGSTFLVKRFDRVGKQRIHFASAMTLLGKIDGASAEDGTGYLDLASFIRTNGSKPKEDLEELWKRMVFNMLVSNTDDHLRNHGFLLEKNGWTLSPLYDVNPTIYGDALSLNVTQDSNLIDLDLALKTAQYYDLKPNKAQEILDTMQETVSKNWMQLAKGCGLSRNAIEYMRPAFTTS